MAGSPTRAMRPGRQKAARGRRPKVVAEGSKDDVEIDVPVTRRATPKSSVEGPRQADGKRARRTFTDEQQRDTAERARQTTVAAAAREVDVVPSLVRQWMRKHP